MAWIEYNPNPRRNRVGDCAIRAVAKATERRQRISEGGRRQESRQGMEAD